MRKEKVLASLATKPGAHNTLLLCLAACCGDKT
jgi:hypothetical protein